MYVFIHFLKYYLVHIKELYVWIDLLFDTCIYVTQKEHNMYKDNTSSVFLIFY